ncbi:MAG TPA: hypothetical protein VGF53_00620 [Pseudolabrys sp.]|jgi:hypothetical protein
MRNIALALLAAAGIALAVPANAESVYIGAGPAGVGVGVSDHHEGWRSHYAYDDDDAVVVRRHRDHCRITIVRHGDEVRKIRRCW